MASILVEKSVKHPGDNQFSVGYRAYIEMSVDQATASDADKLDAALGDAFAIVSSRIECEVERNRELEAVPRHAPQDRAAGTDDNGKDKPSSSDRRPSLITAPQLRLVKTLQKDVGVDASDMVQEVAGHNRIDDLTVKEASQVIDRLKGLQNR